MSDSAQHLDLISTSQSSKEVTANSLFDSLSPGALFGRRAVTTAALSWGMYGGKYRKTDGTLLSVANAVLSLTGSATNYVKETDGVVSVTTTAPAGWPGPLAGGANALYEVVCGAASVTSYIDYRVSGTGSSSGGSGSVGGSNTQVQFNDSGSLGGDADLAWNKTTNVLTIGSTTTAGSIKAPDGTGATAGTNIALQAGTSGTTGNQNGGSVNITAGDGANSGIGGDVNITSGSNAGINVGKVLLRAAQGGSLTSQATIQLGGASAGGISITGSNGKAAGLGGGTVAIAAGTGGTSNQAGGNVTITAGAGGSASSGVLGGNVTITGGAGTSTTTGAAGNTVNMVGGAAGGTGNNNGGNVLLKGGAATGTGAKGNVGVDNGAAIATSATGGFLVIPTCAGTPTGTPANLPTGSVALVFDTTNSKLWIFNGAWKGVTLA